VGPRCSSLAGLGTMCLRLHPAVGVGRPGHKPSGQGRRIFLLWSRGRGCGALCGFVLAWYRLLRDPHSARCDRRLAVDRTTRCARKVAVGQACWTLVALGTWLETDDLLGPELEQNLGAATPRSVAHYQVLTPGPAYYPAGRRLPARPDALSLAVGGASYPSPRPARLLYSRPLFAPSNDLSAMIPMRCQGLVQRLGGCGEYVVARPRLGCASQGVWRGSAVEFRGERPGGLVDVRSRTALGNYYGEQALCFCFAATALLPG